MWIQRNRAQARLCTYFSGRIKLKTNYKLVFRRFCSILNAAMLIPILSLASSSWTLIVSQRARTGEAMPKTGGCISEEEDCSSSEAAAVNTIHSLIAN